MTKPNITENETPGSLLRKYILENLGENKALTFARNSGIAIGSINGYIYRDNKVSEKMADKLELATGIAAETWIMLSNRLHGKISNWTPEEKKLCEKPGGKTCDHRVWETEKSGKEKVLCAKLGKLTKCGGITL